MDWTITNHPCLLDDFLDDGSHTGPKSKVQWFTIYGTPRRLLGQLPNIQLNNDSTMGGNTDILV